LYCAWTKLTNHAGEQWQHIASGPPQKSLPLNRHFIILSLFLLRLMDGIQVLSAAMYLNYFLLIFIVWVGAVVAKEVDNITEHYERWLIG